MNVSLKVYRADKPELLLAERLLVMQDQIQDTAEEPLSVMKDEEAKKENLTEMAASDTEEENEETLPHSEILDIFEEGLARLVQDPLLCDLPIQVLSTL